MLPSTHPLFQTTQLSLPIARIQKSITKVRVLTLLQHRHPPIIIIMALKCSHLLAHFLSQARNLQLDKLLFPPILKILSYWKKKVESKLVFLIKIHCTKMEIYPAMTIIQVKKKLFQFQESSSSQLDFKIPALSFRIKHFKTKIMETCRKIRVFQGNHKIT